MPEGGATLSTTPGGPIGQDSCAGQEHKRDIAVSLLGGTIPVCDHQPLVLDGWPHARGCGPIVCDSGGPDTQEA